MAQKSTPYRPYNGEYNEVMGLCYWLQDAGIPYDLVLEQNLNLKLNSYSYWVVPNADTLLPETIKLLNNPSINVFLAGPNVSKLVFRALNLATVEIAPTTKPLMVFGLSAFPGIMSTLGTVSNSKNISYTHYASRYYAQKKNLSPVTYKLGNFVGTLFPLGLEYKRHQQISFGELFEHLFPNNTLEVKVLKGQVIAVPYKTEKQHIVYFANVAGQHANAEVYQQETVPQSGEVELDIKSTQRPHLSVIPTAHFTVHQGKKGHWLVRLSPVSYLTQLTY
jgi:hypothetical protein